MVSKSESVVSAVDQPAARVDSSECSGRRDTNDGTVEGGNVIKVAAEEISCNNNSGETIKEFGRIDEKNDEDCGVVSVAKVAGAGLGALVAVATTIREGENSHNDGVDRSEPISPNQLEHPAVRPSDSLEIAITNESSLLSSGQEKQLQQTETLASEPATVVDATLESCGPKHLESSGDGNNNDLDDRISVVVECPNLKAMDYADQKQQQPEQVLTLPVDQQMAPRKSIQDEIKKNGWVRHVVALLALSSIVLANTNRQVFNQALSSMVMNATTAKDIAARLVDEALAANQHELIYTAAFADSPETTAATTSAAIMTIGENVTQPHPYSQIQQQQFSIDGDRFNWTKSQIAVLQSAFSYGYMPFMIPGGRMAELYGAKWVVFVSGFGSALCCTVVPLIADNFYLLVASRVIMGMSQTAVSPALYALLTRWLTPEESSVYLPLIKVGVMLGFAFGSIFGILTWRMAFYVIGLIGFLWCILWTFMITSDPGEHKLVEEQELNYIQQEIRRLNKGRKQSTASSRKAPAPWLKILTNPVVLVFMLAKFTVKLSTDAQTTQLPMYLVQVFDVSKKVNSAINTANFAIQCIFTGLVAWLAKEFVVRESYGLNKTGVRRLFQGTCNFGMGLSYIMLTFDMSSLGLAVFSVIILAISSMFGAGGEAVLPTDLSVEYSASIMAIANSAANLSGIVLPELVKFILGGEGDNNWAMVWRAVGSIVVAGGLVFTFGVKAEIQDFRGPRKTTKLKKQAQQTQSADDDDYVYVDATKIEMGVMTISDNNMR